MTDPRILRTGSGSSGTGPTGSSALPFTCITVGVDFFPASLGALEGEETGLVVRDPVRGILGAAERWHADLIVVGTHSQGAVGHFLVGSIAEKVVARSRVPVLTVRRQA